MKKNISLFLVSSFLFGCATPPHKISEQQINERMFYPLDCKQLDNSHTEAITRYKNLELELEDLASTDAAQATVGLFVLPLSLLFLEGGDGPKANEYSRIKGEIKAIQSVSNNKKCPEFSVATIDTVIRIKSDEEERNPNKRCGMYQMCNQISND